MHTLDPRAEARNRANRRLHRMTVGAAALAVASVGLFGATAAFTDDGTPTTSDAVALTVTGDTATTTGTETVSAAATPSTTTPSTPATGTTPAVTSSSGTAHASTGGS